MQAIQTKYFGPTDVRGARIKAECEAMTIYVAWEHSLNIEANHQNAAAKLIKRLGWRADYVSGSLKNGCYAHVLEWHEGCGRGGA